MSALELSLLLHKLKAAGVELIRDCDKLRVIALPGTVTAELAEAIREHKARLLELIDEPVQTAPSVPALGWVSDRETYLLSPEQERNYLAAQRGPGLPTAFRLKGLLRADVLHATLQGFVDRQSALRSVFLDQGTSVKARILPEVKVDLPLVDLEGQDAVRQEESLQTVLSDVAQTVFDLRNGPLFRFTLVRLGPESHVLALSFSQMVFDGYSFDIFLKELSEGYAARHQDRPIPWGPLEAEYTDYVVWQRKNLEQKGPELQAWWQTALGREVPGCPLPTDHPRPPVPSYRGGAVPVEIPSDLLPSLHLLARSSGATLQMVLMTAVAILFQRLSGRDDAWIATPVMGRRHPSLEAMVGAFASMLLIKQELGPELPFSMALPMVRDTSLQAFDHQDIPLDRLSISVRPTSEPGRIPLFQLEFSYQQVSQRTTHAGPVALSQIEVHGGTANNEISLLLKDWGHRVTGILEYALDLYDRPTIEHWRDCLVGILREAAARPDTPVGHLSGLTDPGAQEALRTAQALAWKQRPLWLRWVRTGPGGLSLVDSRSQPLPLGVWGSLRVDGRPLPGTYRLRVSGIWERKKTPKRVRRSQHLRTRVLDPVEFRIIELFESALGAEKVGLQDDFFALGGHSSLGIQILNGIKKHFGVALALGVLFEASTPFALAKRVRWEAGHPDPDTGLIRGPRPVDHGNLVPIQLEGTKPPFFVAAGYGGNPMNLRYVAKYLGPDQPFYGLQHRGTDGRSRPHETIAAAVAEYLGDIRRVQPEGPYFLGGFSAGGLVVFELARELIRVGEKVAVVVMFDANSPTVRYLPPPSKSIGQRWREEGFRFPLTIATRRIGTSLDRLVLRVGDFLSRFDRFRFREQAVQAAWLRAFDRFEVRPLKVDVLLLRAKDRSSSRTIDPTNGWGDLVEGQLSVVAVEGDHISHVAPPHILETAKILKRELERYS